jgi:hypothetical protein
VDERRFDELVKSLAGPISRRQVLKTVAAATVAGLLGAAGTERASARTGALPCANLPKGDCCSYCQTLFPNNTRAAVLCYFDYLAKRQGPCACLANNGTACPSNPARSEAFTCCSAGQTCIQGVCVTCPAHCVECTSSTTCIACESGYTLSNAKCCPTGQTLCSGTCRNLSSDNNNCGACGTTCPSGQTCCKGTCRNLSSDNNNCGTCGTACRVYGTCQSGTCKCGTDPACVRGQVCQSGVCVTSAALLYPYTCDCADGAQLSTCFSDTCTGPSAAAACTTFCTGHSGFLVAACGIVHC